MSLQRQGASDRRLSRSSAWKPAAVLTAGEAGTARTSPTKLSLTQRDIVQVCAEAVQQLGLSRSVGQIFGVVYASPQPVNFAEVVTSLELSKGSVSQGLRFLKELDAIQLRKVPGDRREHFVPETELRRLMVGVLRTRLRKPLQSGILRLKDIQQRLAVSDEPDREFLEQRVGSLQAWHRKVLFVLPLIQRLLGFGSATVATK